MFKAKILCSRCERTVPVAGRIWQFRLRHNKQDEKRRHLGWNCNKCADDIERGID